MILPNKSLYKKLIPVALLAASTSAVYADFSVKDFSPFVGVDVGRSRVEMKKNYGEKIFRKNATFYNLFAGLDFNETFGMEVGYQRDNPRRDKQSLVAGDRVPGGNVIAADTSPRIFDTFLKSKSKYVGATAQYHLFENFNLSMLIGISKINITARHTLLSAGATQYTAQNIRDFLFARTYKKSKLVPMIRLGAKYKFHERVSFRANITWMDTARIKINSDQNGVFIPALNVNASSNSIRIKPSIGYSIGIVANLL